MLWSGARVLITGGLGFIGSGLARHLVDAGSKVTLVDSLIPLYGGNLANIASIRDKVTVNVADVRDPYAMAHLIRGQDFLFNLAGQTSHLDSMQDPHTDLAINATAQLSILEACRKHNPSVRIVFASTRQLYGRPEYLPVDEKHPIRPVDVNGINKLAGEWYHLLYNNVYGIRACALRLTNTYGPGMRIQDARQTFLGIWVRNLLRGEPILVYGDGTQMRDFNYLDDVVDALLRAATTDRALGEVFNLGHHERISLENVARLMICMRAHATYEVIPFPPERKKIDIGDYYSDYSKAKRDLGWEPRVDLRDGLTRTVSYYENRLPEYGGANDTHE